MLDDRVHGRDAPTSYRRVVGRRSAGASPDPVRAMPDGWWGKPWACQQLADQHARFAGVLTPVNRACPRCWCSSTRMSSFRPMRWQRRSRRCAPRGSTCSAPIPAARRAPCPSGSCSRLLPWSWLTTLPLRRAESLAAAVVVCRATASCWPWTRVAYRRAGSHADRARRDARGHRPVACDQAQRRAGDGRGRDAGRDLPDVRRLAQRCVMAMRSRCGRRSGHPGARRRSALLGLAYVVPPVAALRGSRAGLVGYLGRSDRPRRRRPAGRRAGLAGRAGTSVVDADVLRPDRVVVDPPTPPHPPRVRPPPSQVTVLGLRNDHVHMPYRTVRNACTMANRPYTL